jgi:hypothetical protein
METVSVVAENGFSLVASDGDMVATARERERVSPEWHLVKVPIIAGMVFPIAIAMGGFFEATARLVE